MSTCGVVVNLQHIAQSIYIHVLYIAKVECLFLHIFLIPNNYLTDVMVWAPSPTWNNRKKGCSNIRNVRVGFIDYWQSLANNSRALVNLNFREKSLLARIQKNQGNTGFFALSAETYLFVFEPNSTPPSWFISQRQNILCAMVNILIQIYYFTITRHFFIYCLLIRKWSDLCVYYFFICMIWLFLCNIHCIK